MNLTLQLTVYVHTCLYEQTQWLLYGFCNCTYSFPGSAVVLEAKGGIQVKCINLNTVKASTSELGISAAGQI